MPLIDVHNLRALRRKFDVALQNASHVSLLLRNQLVTNAPSSVVPLNVEEGNIGHINLAQCLSLVEW